MGLSPEEVRRFLRALDEDEEFRLAVAAKLGISDVKASIDRLTEIVGGVVNVINSMLNILKDSLSKQDKVLEELKALREGENKLWEEVKAIRETEQRHEEELKALREENNKIWEEIKAIKEENNKIWQEIKALREVEQRHEEELKALRRDFNAFVELEEKRWEEQFKFNKWITNALMEIRDSLGGLYEYYTASWIREWLRAKGFNCDVRVNVTLPVDGSREVDALCYDPLVVGEATVKLTSIEDADREIEKLILNIKAAEKLTGRKLYAAVLAVETLPNEIAQYLRTKTKELGIILVLGREYTW
ncbi:hypothetical protein [Caldivirga maquilingensis]|uniref:PaREP7 n=1 Tax=Caldivirga maquilingensis (strain ATCC 700844 / DSM 13496 / JCM 10307 / IC-167) TaxID=397948 RepID=A8MBJ1_CALMQ|nr:hypothetical protein [Caldivirga maquilingensis]ABW02724.1 paREP7 [Caldivirga maquilingensis IC-167]